MINSEDLPFEKFVAYAARHEESRNTMIAHNTTNRNRRTAEAFGNTEGHQNLKRGEGGKVWNYNQKNQEHNPHPFQVLPVLPMIAGYDGKTKFDISTATSYNCEKIGHLGNKYP